ncbi:hypothetical protein Drose_21955 [Dactylosporangium roseum]|uniref:Uncharacterized protein n=1 Tax=Dactylosporangium roseum TaxID=47989 RepID=A0ABY5ZF82_9ACTN|nr:hypothetical protein [Dactylosporangium roseum]UWZ40840.1 hypothetical protein Drose_21955 [Dactylosporangium roseum]
MAEQVRVPAEDAGSDEFSGFAHTYNGYELHGGLEALAAVVGSVRDRWQRTGGLGEDVDVLRACLFYEARAHRFAGGLGRFGQEPFVAALVARIRSVSGGFVPVKGTVV